MKIFLSAATALFLVSCSLNISYSDTDYPKWKGVKGNGKVVKEKRTIDPDVDKIVLSTFIDVVYTQGNSASMTVEGEENLLEYVKTEVKGNTLYVGKTKNINLRTTRQLRVFVTTSDLTMASCNSSGDFEATNTLRANELQLKTSSSGDIEADVEVDKLELSCSSSGDQDISGTTEFLLARTSSSGDINARNLKSKFCKAKTSSSGDITVYASETIEANTSSSGDIRVKGSPDKRDISESSSGDVYID